MPDQGSEQPTISLPFSGGKRADSYSTGEAMNSEFWASNKPPKNYSNCHGRNEEEVQFGTGAKVEEDKSAISSPHLWTTSPTRSPKSHRNYYRSLSPASKAQAVARGERELMEMVRNMPESNYELSLKDIVEHPRADVGEMNGNLGRKNAPMKEGGNGRNVDKKGQGRGSGKFDSGGLYLKMVFPDYLVSKKKKKNEANHSSKSKVSPRSSVSDGSAKGLDKEWWKKRHSVSDGKGDSGVSSINSGSTTSSSSSSTSSSRSNSRHEMGGGSCWPFIHRRRESISQK